MQQKELQSTLRALGLSRDEAHCYLTLLEEGASTVAALARASGLRRGSVPAVLRTLRERGLVGMLPHGKRTLHVAEPPELLRTLAAQALERLDAAMPELRTSYERPGGMPVTRILEGPAGLRAVWEDLLGTLKRGGTFYRFSSNQGERETGRFLPRDYRDRRKLMRLKRYVITNPGRASRKKPDLDREMRVVPISEADFTHNITQMVYGDRVALIDYNHQLALIIQDLRMAEFAKQVFLLLYVRLPEEGLGARGSGLGARG